MKAPSPRSILILVFLFFAPGGCSRGRADAGAHDGLDTPGMIPRPEPTTPLDDGTPPVAAADPPVAISDSTPANQCDPNYTPCVPIDSDVDCAGGRGNGPSYVRGPVRVIGVDHYRLDADHDGIGCES